MPDKDFDKKDQDRTPTEEELEKFARMDGYDPPDCAPIVEVSYGNC